MCSIGIYTPRTDRTSHDCTGHLIFTIQNQNKSTQRSQVRRTKHIRSQSSVIAHRTHRPQLSPWSQTNQNQQQPQQQKQQQVVYVKMRHVRSVYVWRTPCASATARSIQRRGGYASTFHQLWRLGVIREYAVTRPLLNYFNVIIAHTLCFSLANRHWAWCTVHHQHGAI